MKEMPLRTLEWFAQTDPDDTHDTWHIGHHMDEWLPEREWTQVAHIFSHLDPEDTLRALRTTMDLFESTSNTVAERMGFVVREQLPDQVRAMVQRTVSGRTR